MVNKPLQCRQISMEISFLFKINQIKNKCRALDNSKPTVTSGKPTEVTNGKPTEVGQR